MFLEGSFCGGLGYSYWFLKKLLLQVLKEISGWVSQMIGERVSVLEKTKLAWHGFSSLKLVQFVLFC